MVAFDYFVPWYPPFWQSPELQLLLIGMMLATLEYVPCMQQSAIYIWASTKHLRDAWQSKIPNNLYIASQPWAGLSSLFLQFRQNWFAVCLSNLYLEHCDFYHFGKLLFHKGLQTNITVISSGPCHTYSPVLLQAAEHNSWYPGLRIYWNRISEWYQ